MMIPAAEHVTAFAILMALAVIFAWNVLEVRPTTPVRSLPTTDQFLLEL